jgi:mannose-6-phosphate isomerase
VTPYIFKPICVERPWGGRRLGELFGRELPEGKAIGESWELVDREEACNDIVSGPGVKPGTRQSLHTLWTEKRKEVFGSRAPDLVRFPILIKILDATRNVSVQIHPKAAPGLEPKTEMWYMLETGPDAKIYAGFKKGVTRKDYDAAAGTDRMPALLHTLSPKPSDAMFLPSGRIHALGADIVMLEIQQNSDTTYRVYDWGVVDDKGRSRPLHLEETARDLTFPDVEPQFVQPHGERVLNCPFFSVSRSFIYPGEYRVWTSDHTSFQYHFVAQGELRVENHTFKRGDSWLVPASAESYHLEPIGEGAELVTVQWGS